MTQEPSEPATRDAERRPVLPRHLAALAGVLHGPPDLGANHDAYLTRHLPRGQRLRILPED